ncbi:hypothetical protein AB4Z52_17325 [Rhizobium sp. 2YAF20]|uniref:hypothetical protein n=1 Tax=Rhizobium sp. 2YAF20 TaxID=3233027 RepID=UPI003F99DC0E
MTSLARPLPLGVALGFLDYAFDLHFIVSYCLTGALMSLAREFVGLAGNFVCGATHGLFSTGET